MQPAAQPESGSRRVDLLLLHPTGSRDPQRVSLAVGLLEWLRLGCADKSLIGSLWTETAVDAAGRRRFILRPQPWSDQEIRRKLTLVPSAETVLTLLFDEEEKAEARIFLEDRRRERLFEERFPFTPEEIFHRSSGVLNRLLGALDRTAYPDEPAELFRTDEPMTAMGSLFALERLVAFEAGVGREEPRRLFEPALQCIGRDPANPFARECMVRLGDSMLGSDSAREKEAALDAYRRWSEVAPVSPLPPFYLARAHRAVRDPEPVRTAYEEALRRDPFFAPALQEYALWLGERGFVDQGLSLLQNAIGRTPVDGALLDHAGCLLANSGRIVEAVPFFRASIRAGGPRTAFSNLARSLFSGGEEQEALTVVQEGIARGADHTHLLLLAEIARGSGLAAARSRAILRGIDEEVEEPEALATLAEIVHELDGPEAAAPRARRLLERTASRNLRRHAYILLLRGRIEDLDRRWGEAAHHAVLGEAKESEPFFREVLAAVPEFGQAQFLLALSLDRLGRTSDALPLAEAAARTEEGSDPLLLDLLARARSGAGDLAGAAEAHHRAAAQAPRDPRILRNAAVSLLRAGYLLEGTGLAQRSLALAPDQPDLEEILSRAAKNRLRLWESPKQWFRGFRSRLGR